MTAGKQDQTSAQTRCNQQTFIRTCGRDEGRLWVPGQVQQLGREVGGRGFRLRRTGRCLSGIFSPRQSEAVGLQTG